MPTYSAMKAAVIDVVDRFAKKDEVVAGYGATYTAKTKLDTIGLTGPARHGMPKRFNQALRAVAGDAWHAVGSIDLVEQNTIGDLIGLACNQASVAIPAGEPT